MNSSTAELKEAIHKLFTSTAIGSAVSCTCAMALPFVFNNAAVGAASLSGIATSLVIGVTSLIASQSIYGHPNDLSKETTQRLRNIGLATGIGLPAITSAFISTYFIN